MNSPLTDPDIIRLLGGVAATARLLGIKPPSVHRWLHDGIPEGRLVELGAHIEIKSDGKFSRRERWPTKYSFYWPELAQLPGQQPVAQAAHQVV